MNGTTHNQDIDSELTDERVRQWYRESPAEKTPSHLDQAVLGQAADEAQGGFRWQLPWLRPAALVATIALSFAVILEFNETATRIGEPPDDAAIPQDPANVLDDFSSAAADSTTRIRSIGETAAEREIPGNPLADTFPQATDDAHSCDDDQTATPGTWQQCIDALRQAGRQSEADTESRRLIRTFPDHLGPPE